jgi:hypothetical protein
LTAAVTFSARAAVVPDGFIADTVVSNINAATALAIVPDSRVFYTEQTGAIRIYRDGQLLPAPRPRLKRAARHLLGTRLDRSDVPSRLSAHAAPFVVYVAKSPYTHHVVSRFTLADNSIDPASELVLLEGDDQAQLGGGVPAGHQGGPISFGPDG